MASFWICGISYASSGCYVRVQGGIYGEVIGRVKPVVVEIIDDGVYDREMIGGQDPVNDQGAIVRTWRRCWRSLITELEHGRPCRAPTPPPPPPPSTNPGTGTPGYWKNHPEVWPVEEIVVGGITYSKDDAIAAFKRPVEGDKTLTMFPHLVSAMLNVLIGNDDSCIAGTITAADAWMQQNPLGSGVAGKSDAWKAGEPLSTTLDDYNNGRLCAPHRD